MSRGSRSHASAFGAGTERSRRYITDAAVQPNGPPLPLITFKSGGGKKKKKKKKKKPVEQVRDESVNSTLTQEQLLKNSKSIIDNVLKQRMKDPGTPVFSQGGTR